MRTTLIACIFVLPVAFGLSTGASAMPRICEQYQVSSQLCFQAGLACMGNSACIEPILKRATQKTQRRPARQQTR